MKITFRKISILLLGGVIMTGCQKLDRPGLGDFPQDSNPPGGPLSFYVAFDGTSSNPLMNAVDSIRANFPADNTLTSIDGISGKAIQGKNKSFVKYSSPNDFATLSKSFTIAFWYKKDGQTQNNTLTNGPEYIVSFKSSNGHWSGGNMLVFMEGNNTACAVKMMCADKNLADAWMTWEGANAIAGLLDNKWHHMALVYNASTSGCTLYVDGVANPNVRPWNNHGNINLDGGKISEVRIGGGPQNNWNSNDWLSSTWKGGIDQFRLYNTGLTAGEVKGLFDNKK